MKSKDIIEKCNNLESKNTFLQEVRKVLVGSQSDDIEVNRIAEELKANKLCVTYGGQTGWYVKKAK